MSTWHRTASLDEHGAHVLVELTDDAFEECIAEGFPRTEDGRCAAAWWLFHALPNLCGGDRTQLYHDYPQHPKHLLASSAGRVVEVTPSLAIVDGWLEVQGMRGDTWNVEVYGDEVYEQNAMGDAVLTSAGEPVVIGSERAPHCGQVVVTIDSAQGVSKTNSIVLAVDVLSRRPLMCFSDNTVLHDDLARVAQLVAMQFQPRRSRLHHDVCTVVCEADGAGRHTAHELTFLGVPHQLFFQSKDGNAEKCIVQAKRRVEARPRDAPLVMQEECDELQRDEKNHLKGRKDCLMMYGMANVWIDEHPWVPPVDKAAEQDRANRLYTYEPLRPGERGARVGHARPRTGV